MKRDMTERIDNVLVGSRAIKSLASGTQKLVGNVLGRVRPLKTFLNGTWLEHPLHPVLTDIPIGAWTLAIVLDILALAFGVQNLGVASAIGIGLGVLGALGAAVTGFADWVDVDPPELAVGITHAIINILATVLFAAAFVVMWANGWTIGALDFALAVIGYLTVTAGAYLGGSLVFRMGVMINRAAYQSGPEDWVPVLPMDELMENKPTRVDAEGRPVLLLRRGEEVYAIGAVCSHYGGPLEEGSLKNGSIECPWHQSRFCLADGRVDAGPATSPVPAYQVRLNRNRIEVKAQEK